jgi:hypothetical protein
MGCHRVRNQRVVLDDQNAGHGLSTSNPELARFPIIDGSLPRLSVCMGRAAVSIG